MMFVEDRGGWYGLLGRVITLGKNLVSGGPGPDGAEMTAQWEFPE